MNPSLIIVVASLLLAVILRLAIDNRQIIASKRLRQQVSHYVRRHFRPKIAVIIELNRRAETIMPLLDHIYEMADERVSIIVIIKHTAGKNARPKLAYYRKKYRRKNLELISHKKGLTPLSLAAKRRQTELVVQLEPDSRLSPNFFDQTRLRFIDDKVSAVIPRRLYQVSNSLTSAVQAGILNWRQIDSELSAPALVAQDKLTPGIIYRQSYLAGQTTSLAVIYSSSVYITIPPETTSTPARSGRLHIGLSLVWVGLLSLAAYISASSHDTMPLLWSVGSFILICATVQLSSSGYKSTQKLSLVLLSPLILLIDLVLILGQAAKIFLPSRQMHRRSSSPHLLATQTKP